MSSNGPILQAKGINKYFHDPITVKVLKEVTFELKRGEFVSVIGKSGCGKSTLLYILSTMDTDYEGDLFLDGVRTHDLEHDQLSHLRSEKIGFVFQFHYLLPEFSVLRNVMLPGLKLARYSEQEVEERAMHKLEMLGISDQAKKKANQISGGQKQRVAIARSLINDPAILMCDEPTGNLDSRNSEVVFEIFQKLAANGQTLLVVTHDEDLASRTHRIIEMDDGKVIRQ